jgi:hypothetical protein
MLEAQGICGKKPEAQRILAASVFVTDMRHGEEPLVATR